MLHTWAAVFGLEESAHFEDDVTACVVALRQEIDFARLRLTAQGVPDDLTQTGFSRLKGTASVGYFHTNWHSHRGNIQPPENRLAFAWAAWVLRDEDETTMSADALSSLRAEIVSLEQSLEETELSPYLRDFIQRQLDTIRAALRVYGVQGARPLKEAIEKVAGAYALDKPMLDSEVGKEMEAGKGLVSRTGDILRQTAEVCGNAEKIVSFGEKVTSFGVSAGTLLLGLIK